MFCGSKILLAAIGEEATSESMINMIVHERNKAQQEYQLYKAQKDFKAAPAESISQKPAFQENEVYAKTGKDAAIGIVLIIIAIMLTIYLHNISKKQGQDS